MHHKSLLPVSLLALVLAAPASAADVANDTEHFSVLSLSFPDLDEPGLVETDGIEPGEGVTLELPEGKSRLKVEMSQQVHFVFGTADYGTANELRIGYDEDGPKLAATDGRGDIFEIPGVLINTRGGAGDDEVAVDYRVLVPPADAEDAAAALSSSPDELGTGWRGRVAFGETEGQGRIRAGRDGLVLTVSGKLGRNTPEKLLDTAMSDGWLWYVAVEIPGSAGRAMAYELADEMAPVKTDILAQLRDQARENSGRALIASIQGLDAAGQHPGTDPDTDMLCALVVLDFAKKTWRLSFAPLSRAEAMLDEPA